jgi:opacity protein-like surface antigen
MVPRFLTAASVATLLLSAASAAHAQSKVCKNKVFVDSVYQNSTGGKEFEYMLQLRNGTSAPLHWQINFRNLPANVSAFSPQISSGSDTLGPHQSKTLRFAKGTNGNINTNTVQVGYDATGAMIVVANCY